MALNRDDVRVETVSSGPGAPGSIRMTHVPTGAVVVDEGSGARSHYLRLKELWERLEAEVARRQDSRP